MRKLAVVAMVVMALMTTVMALAQDEPAAAPDLKEQTMCPVDNKPIDKAFFADHEGFRVYFCSQACVDAFKAEPAKYMEALKGVKLEAAPAAPAAEPAAEPKTE